MKRIVTPFLVLACAAALASPAPHGKVEEHYPSGQVKVLARYKHGILDGSFTRYHASGKVAVKARYAKGELHGKYEERDADGKPTLKATYKNGKLHGVVRRLDGKRVVAEERWELGQLLYPRSIRQIKARLGEIAARSAAGFSASEAAALARLNSHRFLVGLADDVVLDADMNARTRAGADLCKRIGRLDHKPANPGMEPKAFEYAYSGTSSSNLYKGGDDLARSVDAYMDDSDPTNIDRVGHRRWCLSPVMQKTGFGGEDGYSAMWAFDASRAEVDYDFFSYPARGFQPVSYFAKRSAWSVSFNLSRYAVDRGQVAVRVFPLQGRETRPNPQRAPLELDHFVADSSPMAGTYCVIFRPAAAQVAAGQRYWVEVAGVTLQDGTQEGPVGFLVEFVRL